MPKKRKAESDEEYVEKPASDDGDDDDLYTDEADRARLEEMNDRDRETELYDRRQKRKEQRDRQKALKNEQAKQKKQKTTPEDKPKTPEEEETKIEEIEEIEERIEAEMQNEEEARKKQEEAEGREKNGDVDEEGQNGEGVEGGGEGEIDDEDSEIHKKKKKSNALEDAEEPIVEEEEEENAEAPTAVIENEDDVLEGNESEAEAEDKENAEKEEKIQKKKAKEEIVETPAKVEDIKKIQLRRVALEKLLDEPYFDSFVIGMFCRVTIGARKDGSPAYRLCEITGVKDYHRPYPFGGQKNIKKALTLKHGKANRLFMMSAVSNSTITSGDFDRWLKELKRYSIPLITREEITRIARERKALREKFVYTPAMVQELVSKRQKDGKNVNLALEKNRLFQERDKAMDKGDTKKYDQFVRKIEELEEKELQLRRRNQDTRALGLISLNEKQKVQLAKRWEELGKVEKKKMAEGTLNMTAGRKDQSRRRATRPSQFDPTFDEEKKEEKKPEEKKKEEKLSAEEKIDAILEKKRGAAEARRKAQNEVDAELLKFSEGSGSQDSEQDPASTSSSSSSSTTIPPLPFSTPSLTKNNSTIIEEILPLPIDPRVHTSLLTSTKNPCDDAYEALNNAYKIEINIDVEAPISRRCICGVRLSDEPSQPGVPSHKHSAEHVFNVNGPGIQFWTRPKGEILTIHDYVARTWPEDNE